MAICAGWRASRAEMGRAGGHRAAFWRICGLDRAGTDPGSRAGWFKWRGMANEWAKASAPGRRAVSGRRARQLWLLAARWLGCPVCACRQPASGRKRGSWAAVRLHQAWLCGCGACCARSCFGRLCCHPQAHCQLNVRGFVWTIAGHYAPLSHSPLASLVQIIW